MFAVVTLRGNPFPHSECLLTIKNKLFTLAFLSLLTTGCPKKTEPVPPAELAAVAVAEEPAAESLNTEADPAKVAADFCDCILRHPQMTDREGGMACLKTLFVNNDLAEPDPNTPPYTRTVGGVTQRVPRLFASDADMEAYADAMDKCVLEIGEIDSKFKAQTWTDAPCEEQCGAEPEANQALCNTYCGARE